LAARSYDTPDRAGVLEERLRTEQIMEQRRQQARSNGYVVASVPHVQSERDLKKARCKAAQERAHRAAFDGTPDSLRAVYERAAIDECFGL
jgi:hypothetical protein